MQSVHPQSPALVRHYWYWRRHPAGYPLTARREIHFRLAFDAPAAMQAFAVHLLMHEQPVQCPPDHDRMRTPCVVIARPVLLPLPGHLAGYGRILACEAARRGGRLEGVACMRDLSLAQKEQAEVVFSLLFRESDAAIAFGERLLRGGHAVQCTRHPRRWWQLLVTVMMRRCPDQTDAHVAWLERQVALAGGELEGWH